LDAFWTNPDGLDMVIGNHSQSEWFASVLRIFHGDSILMFLSILGIIQLTHYDREYSITGTYVSHAYALLSRDVYNYTLSVFTRDVDYTPIVTPFIILRLFDTRLFIGIPGQC
jgi:hypothetical protein